MSLNSSCPGSCLLCLAHCVSLAMVGPLGSARPEGSALKCYNSIQGVFFLGISYLFLFITFFIYLIYLYVYAAHRFIPADRLIS